MATHTGSIPIARAILRAQGPAATKAKVMPSTPDSACAAMTSNMRLADAPGNVRVTRRSSGLPQESVVNVSHLITLDKQRLTEKVGRLPAESLRDVEAGIRLVLAL